MRIIVCHQGIVDLQLKWLRRGGHQGRQRKDDGEIRDGARRNGKIAADCDDILAFLQAVTAKSPRVAAVPLLLHLDKREWYWFRRCSEDHLTPFFTPLSVAPQDHSGITNVLINTAMRILNT